jgi:hypothetical protein
MWAARDNGRDVDWLFDFLNGRRYDDELDFRTGKRACVYGRGCPALA